MTPGPAAAGGLPDYVTALNSPLKHCTRPPLVFWLQVLGRECHNQQLPMLPAVLIDAASAVCPF